MLIIEKLTVRVYDPTQFTLISLLVSSVVALVAVVGLIVSICNNRKIYRENQRLNKIQLQNKFPFFELINPHVDNLPEVNFAFPEISHFMKIIKEEPEDYYMLTIDSSIEDSGKPDRQYYCSNLWFDLKNKSDSIIKEIVIEKVAYQRPKRIESEAVFTEGHVDTVENYDTIKGVFYKGDKIKIRVKHCFENDRIFKAYNEELVCISFLIRITIISGVTFFENIRLEGYSGTRPSSLSYLHSEERMEIEYLKENVVILI